MTKNLRMLGASSTEDSEGRGRIAPSMPPPDKLIGRTIDSRYKVESVIGEGGMGLVYRARHATLKKLLAIKVLKPDVSKDDEVIRRFRQEAQAATAIGNQHIIDIIDFGTLPDASTYFVMEYLDGTDLTHAISEANAMSQPRVIHVARQLCRALGAAHEAGIVHRDLKPDNIFLVKRGDDRDFVKVLDFGIAKVGSTTRKLTKAGQVFGTPHYMSPEQCAGASTDGRTDIYALGVIMYEMVTGQLPFNSETLMGVLTKQMYEAPTPPSGLDGIKTVDPEFEAIILKCLVKDPAGRYQRMSELLADLERLNAGMPPEAVLHGGSEFEPYPLSGTHRFSIRQSRVRTGAIAVVVVAVGVVFAALYSSPSRSGEEASALEGAAAREAANEAARKVEAAAPVAPTPVVPAETVVTLSSDPAGAEVFDESGAYVGVAPVEVKIPPGPGRKFSFRLKGYENVDQPISPSVAGGKATVRLQKRVRRAPVAASPPKVAPVKPTQPAPVSPSHSSGTIDPWESNQ